MTTSRLSPDAILEQTGLTGSLSAIIDDPDSPDGSWLTTSSNTATALRTSFGALPAGATLRAGAGLQNFHVLVRKTGQSTNPTCTVDLYENGTLVSTLVNATTVSSTSGTVLTGTFDASLLTNQDGSGVEVRVSGATGGGNPGNRASVEVGAVEWNATYDTPTTNSGSFVADAQISAPPVSGSFTADAQISAAPVGQYQQEVLNDAPLLYLRLDETSGTVATNLGSGGNDGTYLGSPTLGQPGAIASDPGDYSITMSGATGQCVKHQGQSIQVGDSFSIEGWIKLADLTATQHLFSASGSGSPPLVKFNSNLDGGIQLNSGNNIIIAVTAGGILDTNWHHVVVTKDGSDVHIYLDGTDLPITIVTPTTFGVFGSGDTFWGIGPDGLGGALIGGLDEVAYYDTALTAARVAAHYQAATQASGGTGSFTADAYVKKITAASLTADAQIAARVAHANTLPRKLIFRLLDPLSSFVANAYISAGRTGSLSAEASIKSTSSGSLTADAFIRKTTLGTLSADAYVKRAGQAGSFAANAQLTKTLSASLTADAAIRRTMLGFVTADALIGRLGLSGSLTANALIRRLGIAGTLTADAAILQGGTGSFTADAFLRRLGLTGSLTLDADIMQPRTDSLTADAYVARSGLTATLTADAAILRVWTGSFVANANVAGTVAGSLTANAEISEPGTTTEFGSITADANLAGTVSGMLTAEAAIQVGRTGSLSANAFIKRAQAGTLAADAAIRRTFSGSLTATGDIRVTRTGSVTAGANLAGTVGSSFTAAAQISAPSSGFITLDAIVRRLGISESFTIDSLVQRTLAGSFAANANILQVRVSSLTADSLIKRSLAGSFSADAEISQASASTVESSFTARANVAATASDGLTAEAFILRAGLNGSVTADAAILRTRLTSFVADAHVGRSTAGSFTIDALVRVTTSQSLAAEALIRKALAGSFDLDAAISVERLASLTADAHLAGTSESSFEAHGWISNPNAATAIDAVSVVEDPILLGSSVYQIRTVSIIRDSLSADSVIED